MNFILSNYILSFSLYIYLYVIEEILENDPIHPLENKFFINSHVVHICYYLVFL